MDIGLLKDHYFFEMSRKRHLQAAIAFPATIYGALLGVVSLYVRDYPAPLDMWGILLNVFLWPAVLSMLLTFYFLARSVMRLNYTELASMQALHEHHEALRQYAGLAAKKVEEADRMFEEGVKKRYREAIDRNSFLNQKRAAYLYTAMLFLIVAIVLVGLCAIPHSIIDKNSSDQPPQVRMVG